MTRFRYDCRLRWSDMDALGHVNNVQYVRYLEDARVALLFDGARQDGIGSFDSSLVVVRHEIDYRRPLVFRQDPVPLELWVTAVRNSSFVVQYELRDGDAVCMEARSVIAPYDVRSGRARRLAPRERAWLERYQEPAAVDLETDRAGGSVSG